VKIAFDIQPLLIEEKGGVAFAEDACIRTLIGQHPEDDFCLGYFNKPFSAPKTNRSSADVYLKDNISVNPGKFLPNPLYRLISTLFPVPYPWFIKTNADISHFFNFIIPPFVPGKKIVTIHDMAFRQFPETVRAKTKFMLRLNLRKTIKRADLIVTVSEFSRQEILNFYNYPAEKIKVIHNGVDPLIYHERVRDEQKDAMQKLRTKYGIGGKYILYLGTIEPRKNLERLIKAYALVKSRHADFPLLVLAGGKGWLYDGIFRTAKESRLENQVIFTGYVSDEEKPPLLAGAEMFCFPSLYEGFGMPVLEAMACGTPVLVSNNSSLPEVAGDAAVLVNAYSIEDMASSMERLYFDGELRRQLREKGIERAKKFTWQNAAKQLYDLYKEAVGSK
jgi:glycosyltransferase involved in cell wall biosynthesis